MSDDLLERIKALQFDDREAAESLTRDFIRSTFDLNVATVEIRPLAVSLNSFNGFLTLGDGERLFFKTHTEPDNVIGEYYHGNVMAEAGYPVLLPKFSSTEAGKHLLIYDVISDPSVFDVAWEIETGQRDDLGALTTAQNDSDDQLREIYAQTLAEQTAGDNARTPVHQLFHHRLSRGRLARFYGWQPGTDRRIKLPGGEVALREVRHVRWHVNGQRYEQSLDDLIGQALRLLNPEQAGVSIIGHGDAHNGNVFYRQTGGSPWLMYFDPAFAGRHHPLLDLTKPLFHNVFAMWMYYPQVKHEQTTISLRREGDVWHVDYEYPLHLVREMFLHSKVERVLKPVLVELKRRGWLSEDWAAFLKAALFCCPFLTMNLTDSDRFTPEISLLGLAQSVEMGGESQGQRSLIDQVLDDVRSELGH